MGFIEERDGVQSSLLACNNFCPLTLVVEIDDGISVEGNTKLVVVWCELEFALVIVDTNLYAVTKLLSIRGDCGLLFIPVLLLDHDSEGEVVDVAVVSSEEVVSVDPVSSNVEVAVIVGLRDVLVLNPLI